jgi:hypothetical protein
MPLILGKGPSPSSCRFDASELALAWAIDLVDSGLRNSCPWFFLNRSYHRSSPQGLWGSGDMRWPVRKWRLFQIFLYISAVYGISSIRKWCRITSNPWVSQVTSGLAAPTAMPGQRKPKSVQRDWRMESKNPGAPRRSRDGSVYVIGSTKSDDVPGIFWDFERFPKGRCLVWCAVVGYSLMF